MKQKNRYIMEHYEDRLLVAASNYFKSIVFIFLAEKHLKEQDLISSVVESYYSIFHLSISRIKLFAGYHFDPSTELCDSNDPSRKKSSHKGTQKLIETMVEQSLLPKSFLELLKDLERKRIYVNYGPRLSRRKNEYIFDTSSYPSLMRDAKNGIQLIKRAFNDYVDSLQKISKETYLFISIYQDFYFNGVYSKMNLCSIEVLNSAREFHSDVHKNYVRMKKI